MEEGDRFYIPVGVQRMTATTWPGTAYFYVYYHNYRWERRSVISYGVDELSAYAHALKLLNRLRKRADKRRSN